MLAGKRLFTNFIKVLWLAALASALQVTAPIVVPALAAQSAENSRPLDVLLIATYSQNNPATHDLETGLNDALQFSIGLNNFHTEYLDVPRLSDTQSGQLLTEYLAAKFRTHPPDYIVAWAPSAYQLLRANPGLFPDSKRIYLETAQPGEGEVEAASNSSWIEVANDYVSSLTELKRFYNPDTLYVVGEDKDKAALDRRNNFRSAFEKVMPAVNVVYLDNWKSADIVARLNADAGHKSAVYYLLQFRDGEELMTPFRFLERLTHQSKLPVFSLWESHMGSGAVGGALFNHREVGKSIGLALLAGTPTRGKLAVQTMANSYDWQAVQHWNLDTSRIPDDARLINRPDNLFYKYRYYLLAIASVIIVLSVLSMNLASTVKARDAALAELELERGGLARKVAERTLELGKSVDDLNRKNAELHRHLHEIKTLKGIIPICSFCKKIRNDRGYWDMVESYISQQTDAQFSHGVCPECVTKEYDDIM